MCSRLTVPQDPDTSRSAQFRSGPEALDGSQSTAWNCDPSTHVRTYVSELIGCYSNGLNRHESAKLCPVGWTSLSLSYFISISIGKQYSAITYRIKEKCAARKASVTFLNKAISEQSNIVSMVYSETEMLSILLTKILANHRSGSQINTSSKICTKQIDLKSLRKLHVRLFSSLVKLFYFSHCYFFLLPLWWLNTYIKRIHQLVWQLERLQSVIARVLRVKGQMIAQREQHSTIHYTRMLNRLWILLLYVCMYKNLCSRSSLQPRLSRRRYDQL